MERINKILVPTDFSDCSREAIEYAVTLAQQLDATLLLTHAMERTVYPVDFALPEQVIYPHLRKEVAAELERNAALWNGKGVCIETHLVKGEPSDAIVQAAKDFECDLIVMGTHGRRGFSRALMGSVAEQVIRSSVVPVLTVRQHKREPIRRPEMESEGIAASAR